MALFIDITDLDFFGPSLSTTMSLCGGCRTVYTVEACPKCASKSSLIYMDRRPLLLSADIISALNAEITGISKLLSTIEGEEERDRYINGIVPFISSVIDQSILAEDNKKTKSAGYRETDLSSAEVVALALSLCVPPTSSKDVR